ncbi:L-serine ammonia-lyase [Propionicimonas sp.]|uniref:L-serine ammonia-lyase n=1 Tax=Propionicimonas sp. TaxID=1955623 RepID=UPI0039E3A066
MALSPAAGPGGGVYVSALELFSIGIGPSSSHTVGPMRAAREFRGGLVDSGLWEQTTRLRCRLLGSLGATGVGHGTPDAVLAGWSGYAPETVDPGLVHGRWDGLVDGAVLPVGGSLVTAGDISFEPRNREYSHPNTLVFDAYAGERLVREEIYLSVGGGFIERLGDPSARRGDALPESTYRTMAELLGQCAGRPIADLAWTDEVAFHGEARAVRGLGAIADAMDACVRNGLRTDGMLPGRLGVRRRAASAWRELAERGDPADSAEALSVYALAVNEENAAGGRVVTAPTNGAAGVLPAVLTFARHRYRLGADGVRSFLLTATAIGSIIKSNASISGAEAGCQAEVGSACAMAAAGLTAVRGGTPEQVENAAEIAIEHHLGLTCDPVGGLVQVPCIERNAVAASTALTASRLATLGDGSHVVGLDAAIETMRQTGADMSSRYKETSAAGLAVNVVEC